MYYDIEGIKTIRIRKVEDGGYCMDPNNLEVFKINETGEIILRMINEGKKLEQIVNYLTNEYEVEAEEVQTIILDFVKTLPFKNCIINKLFETEILYYIK